MHSRPHKIDKEATAKAGFASKFSYVSFRVHPGSDPQHQCEYLAGLEDKGKRRLEIFERDEFRCVDCGKRVDPNLPEYLPNAAHWAHGGNTKVSRCDCKENGKTKCSFCHMVKEHGRYPR